MMNLDIKKLWTAALLSSEYEQTHGVLHDNDGYCCLGVLCDLYAKDTNTVWQTDGVTFSLNGESEILLVDVTIWAGLPNRNPVIQLQPGINAQLSDANDNERLTFSAIAKLIDEQL